MRFWGKTKQGEKKPSRDKLICGADSMDGDYGDTGPLLAEGGYRGKGQGHTVCLEKGHMRQCYMRA